jgi:hypothetical protein
MYVPQTEQLPSMAAPRPEGLEKAASAWKAAATTASLRGKAGPEVQSAHRKEAALPATGGAATDEPVLATLDEPEPAKPRRKFSWPAALLIVLAMAGLGLVFAAPYLPKPEATGAGELAEDASPLNLKGIEDHQFHGHLQMLAPCVAGGALLCLIAALVMGKFDFPSLLLLYLTTAGASLVLLLALQSYSGEAEILRRAGELAERRKAAGQPEFTVDRGLQLPALVGGAAGACLLLLLAAVVVHRRWWSKLLSFLVLGVLIALAPAWVYKEQWGLSEYIPKEVKDVMPF